MNNIDIHLETTRILTLFWNLILQSDLINILTKNTNGNTLKCPFQKVGVTVQTPACNKARFMSSKEALMAFCNSADLGRDFKDHKKPEQQ